MSNSTSIATALLMAWVSGWFFGFLFGHFPRRRTGRFIRARNATVTFTPGPVACSNRGDDPATPKPVIVPKPQFPAPQRLPGDTP